MLRSFEPNAITCGVNSKPFDDDKCNSLLQAIPADVSPAKSWGGRGQGRVDNELPYAYELRRELIFAVISQS